MATLTEKECKAFKFNVNGSNRHTDAYGLFLQVRRNGTKYWGLRISTKQIQKTQKLGEYPYMSLKGARIKAINARNEILNGSARVHNFGRIAREWLASRRDKINEKSYRNTLSRLQNYVFPTLL